MHQFQRPKMCLFRRNIGKSHPEYVKKAHFWSLKLMHLSDYRGLYETLADPY